MARKAYLYQRFSSDQQRENGSLFRQTEANKGIAHRIRKPFWFDKEGKLNQYDVTVKDIFELYISGLGQVSILNKLQAKYPNFKPIQKMSPTTIIKIIKNEMTIGKWHENRVYEPVVTDDIFYEANTINKNRLFKCVKPDRK